MNDVAQQTVGQMRAGDHHCLSFGTDAEQQEVLTSYIDNGLAHHEQVTYFAADDPVAVLDFLRAGGLEPDRYAAIGQLRVMAPQEAFLAYRPFDPDAMLGELRRAVDMAVAAGYQGLRVTGEPRVLRGRPGSDKWREYEHKVADIFSDRPVLGLCQYDRRVFTPAEISDVESLHTHTVVPDPLYQDPHLSIFPMFQPPGFRMVGELDIAQVAAWLNWISRAAAGTEDDLRLDLADLRFIDVAGARMLALLSDRLAQRGRRLVLQALQPAQCIVFHMAGWDRLPNLILAEAQR
ncbi:MEDS domain-containing protein [Actinopolymorpha sp. NPDC004070]|uniref:MEDS domain-containing protein n=1 Tax=Actinopolymorpha sp. NPDC004070 TaxID=3154548 RepID=UPI0033B4817F